MIPVDKSHQVGMHQLATFGHARRAGSIEQDEKIVRLYIDVSKSRSFDISNILCQ